MTRIAITLPKELVNKFDEVLKENGFKVRGRGIQKAMEEYIVQHK